MPERTGESEQASLALHGNEDAEGSQQENDSRTGDAIFTSYRKSEDSKSLIGVEKDDEGFIGSTSFRFRLWSVDHLCQAAGFANIKSASAWAAELNGRVLFPTAAVLQWWFFNVFLVLLNKWIFQHHFFHFPLTLTAIHFAISFLGAFICIRILGTNRLAEVSRHDLFLRVLPMAVVTNLNVCLGNVSLRYIPVTFMQTIKAFTPATTVFLQSMFLSRPFDSQVYLALLPVVGGVTIASATELSFHLGGFLAAFISTVFTSANSILAEVLLHGHVSMDSINTVYYMAPLNVLMLVPLGMYFEGPSMVAWFYNAPIHRWGGAIPVNSIALILFSGVLAFGLNYSLFYAIQHTSAMTFNVAGNLKVAVAMLLGWLIYRNPMSIMSTAGCVVTCVGCLWYGYVMHQIRVHKEQEKPVLTLPQEVQPDTVQVDEEAPLLFREKN